MYSSISSSNKFLLSFFVICFLFFYLTSQAFGLDSGCIKGDCVNGEGTYVREDGTIYQGKWKNGKLNGSGFIILKGKNGWKLLVRFKDGSFDNSDFDCNYGGDCNYSDRFHRKILLTKLSRSFNCLNNLLPNPKPSEIEWVKKEQQAIDKMLEEATSWEQKRKVLESDRRINFYSSLERTKVKIKENMKELVNLINKIKSYYENLEINNEMIYWAKLSSKNIKFHPYWDTELKIIKETVLVSLEEDYKCGINWNDNEPWTGNYLDGLKIYEQIIIPYLEGKIKN